MGRQQGPEPEDAMTPIAAVADLLPAGAVLPLGAALVAAGLVGISLAVRRLGAAFRADRAADRASSAAFFAAQDRAFGRRADLPKRRAA
jgi:hypothetical protein